MQAASTLEQSVREKRRPGEIASRRRFGAKSLRLIAFVALTVLTPLAAREAPNTVNTASSEPSQPQIRPEATASTAAPADTIPRKVLVLDFVNQAKDTKSDYLSVSVAEALLDPLKKTGKFYLLPRGNPLPASPYSPLAGGELSYYSKCPQHKSYSPP
jgi:hypothetical protein